MSDPEAYPLDWPTGWPVTPPYNRRYGHFTTNFGKARDGLLDEVRKLGGRNLIISSDVQLRNDGLPRADFAKRDIPNPGVAIYFQWKGKSYAIACDKFRSVQDNMRAVGLTIESIRALERYGASSIMERAFSGFAALPAPIQMGRTCWQILDLGTPSDEGAPSTDDIERAYRELARKYHPDVGGSTQQMAELNAAREQALLEVTA